MKYIVLLMVVFAVPFFTSDAVASIQYCSQMKAFKLSLTANELVRLLKLKDKWDPKISTFSLDRALAATKMIEVLRLNDSVPMGRGQRLLVDFSPDLVDAQRMIQYLEKVEFGLSDSTIANLPEEMRKVRHYLTQDFLSDFGEVSSRVHRSFVNIFVTMAKNGTLLREDLEKLANFRRNGTLGSIFSVSVSSRRGGEKYREFPFQSIDSNLVLWKSARAMNIELTDMEGVVFLLLKQLYPTTLITEIPSGHFRTVLELLEKAVTDSEVLEALKQIVTQSVAK